MMLGKNLDDLRKEREKAVQFEIHVKELRAELKTKKALLRKCEREYAPLAENKYILEAALGTHKSELFLINKQYEDLRAEVDENKKKIEDKMRERDLLNKDKV